MKKLKQIYLLLIRDLEQLLVINLLKEFFLNNTVNKKKFLNFSERIVNDGNSKK